MDQVRPIAEGGWRSLEVDSLKQSQRIVKNAVSGAVSAVVGGGLQLFTTLLIARMFDLTHFGTFNFVLAFAGVFQLLADCGLSNVLVRELATQKSHAAELMGAAKSLIWLLSAGSLVVMLIIVALMRAPAETKLLLIIMGLATLAQFHSAGYTAVFRAYEDMELNALGYVVHKVILLALVFGCVQLKQGLWGVVVVHFVANLALWAFYYLVVSRRYLRPKLIANPLLWKALLWTAIPLGGGMILRQLAWQFDILVLNRMSTPADVGLFSGPYRIVMALNLIPLIFALPVFPVFARLARDSRAGLHDAYVRTVKYFCLASLPLAALFVVWSGPLIRLLLGEKFAPSTYALQVFGLAIVPLFVTTLFPYLFTALNQQKLFLVTTMLVLVLRVVLNFLLIPYYGYLGPCIAVVVSEVFVLAMWVHELGRLRLTLELKDTVLRPLLATAAMAAVLYFAKDWPVALAAGGCVVAVLVYAAALVALRTFSPDEVRLAKEGFRFFRLPSLTRVGAL